MSTVEGQTPKNITTEPLTAALIHNMFLVEVYKELDMQNEVNIFEKIVKDIRELMLKSGFDPDLRIQVYLNLLNKFIDRKRPLSQDPQ